MMNFVLGLSLFDDFLTRRISQLEIMRPALVWPNRFSDFRSDVNRIEGDELNKTLTGERWPSTLHCVDDISGVVHTVIDDTV